MNSLENHNKPYRVQGISDVSKQFGLNLASSELNPFGRTRIRVEFRRILVLSSRFSLFSLELKSLRRRRHFQTILLRLFNSLDIVVQSELRRKSKIPKNSLKTFGKHRKTAILLMTLAESGVATKTSLVLMRILEFRPEILGRSLLFLVQKKLYQTFQSLFSINPLLKTNTSSLSLTPQPYQVQTKEVLKVSIAILQFCRLF